MAETRQERRVRSGEDRLLDEPREPKSAAARTDYTVWERPPIINPDIYAENYTSLDDLTPEQQARALANMAILERQYRLPDEPMQPESGAPSTGEHR